MLPYNRISISFKNLSSILNLSLFSFIIFLESNGLNFYPPKSCFRILISYLEFWFKFLESKISFSADISLFYVMIYNSNTWIGILNTDSDRNLRHYRVIAFFNQRNKKVSRVQIFKKHWLFTRKRLRRNYTMFTS